MIKQKMMKKEDLKNTKIYLSNEEDRIKFQEKVLKLGVTWTDCNRGNTFFIIDEHLDMFIGWGESVFINKREKQIFLDDVLAIEEPKVEFKPYDKVLVRDSDNRRWRPRLFAWHNVDYKEDYSYPFEATDGVPYRYCIPYKGNEELANTTKSPKQ